MNYWYPRYGEELYQNINGCDVDWTYQGYIVSSHVPLRKYIEDAMTAHEICQRRNDQQHGYGVYQQKRKRTIAPFDTVFITVNTAAQAADGGQE